MEVVLIIVAALSFLTALFLFAYIKNTEIDKRQSTAIRDLDRRITDLLQNQLGEIRGSVDNTSQRMHQQIYSFTQETIRMRKDLEEMQKNIGNISSFQEIFRSPKLRGQWGEASLEYILSQHFPQKMYKIQHCFSSGLQVDAVVKLPDDKLLPIDAKFNLENFQRMVETKEEGEKKMYQKKFISDLKIQVDSIVSKYILPKEGTVDLALMYIPAEAVYYEIINKIGQEFDVANYAWKRRVVLTSPNTFYLTLQTILWWFRDTELSRHTQRILKRLEAIRYDGEKLTQEFRKLGTHLKNVNSAFTRSEHRLSLLGERTKRLIEEKQIKQLKSSD